MTTEPTTRVSESTAPPAVLYVAFELGSTKWTLASSPAIHHPPRVREVRAGDLAAVQREWDAAKARFGLPQTAAVRTCYEAGRDGFWVHRWVTQVGATSVVVDAASIEVNRRARRAKTDRLDAGALLRLLHRWWSGERRVWSVVTVPTPEAEAARVLPREIALVTEERKAVRNRIHSLLATQGIRLAVTAGFLDRLAASVTGDGRPLSTVWQARLTREWQHLAAIDARLATLRADRRAAVAAGTDRVLQVARQLCTLRGVAETSALLFSAELFGTRTFTNGRQIGALTGLAPVPYRSDQRVTDAGISKAGRGEIRRVALQIAWGWLRWQPDSALTQWFLRRFAAAGGRSKRVGIVAVARKLLIALWRFVAHGVLPEGARLTPTRA